MESWKGNEKNGRTGGRKRLRGSEMKGERKRERAYIIIFSEERGRKAISNQSEGKQWEEWGGEWNIVLKKQKWRRKKRLKDNFYQNPEFYLFFTYFFFIAATKCCVIVFLLRFVIVVNLCNRFRVVSHILLFSE